MTEFERLKMLMREMGSFQVSEDELDVLKRLLAVVEAAKTLRENTDECGDSPTELRWALSVALEELEKE